MAIWAWIPSFNGNPVLLRSTALQDAEAQFRHEASGVVAWASAVQPEISLLNTFLNQTGAFAESAAVAKSVLKRFDDELSPTGPLDAGWLATLEALDAQGFDADAIRSGDKTSVCARRRRRARSKSPTPQTSWRCGIWRGQPDAELQSLLRGQASRAAQTERARVAPGLFRFLGRSSSTRTSPCRERSRPLHP